MQQLHKLFAENQNVLLHLDDSHLTVVQLLAAGRLTLNRRLGKLVSAFNQLQEREDVLHRLSFAKEFQVPLHAFQFQLDLFLSVVVVALLLGFCSLLELGVFFGLWYVD